MFRKHHHSTQRRSKKLKSSALEGLAHHEYVTALVDLHAECKELARAEDPSIDVRALLEELGMGGVVN